MSAHRHPVTNQPMYPIAGRPFPEFYTSQCQEAGHTFECRPMQSDGCVHCGGNRPPPMFLDDRENVVFSSVMTPEILDAFKLIATQGDQQHFMTGGSAKELVPLHDAGLIEVQTTAPFPFVLTATGARYWHKIVAAQSSVVSAPDGASL